MKKKTKLPSVAITLTALVLLVVSVGVVKADAGSLIERISQVAGTVLGQLLHQDVRDEVVVAGASDVLGGMGAPNSRGTGNRTDVLTLKDSNSDNAWEHYTEIVPLVVATSSVSWLQDQDGIVEIQVEFLPQASATSTQEGRASSTLLVAVGTSTIAQAPNHDVDLTSTSIVPQGLIPVSAMTTGTLFRSFVLSSESLNNQIYLVGTRASSTWVRVPQGQYVTMFRTTGGSNAIHGSSATSTAGLGMDLVNSFLSIMVRRMATSTP